MKKLIILATSLLIFSIAFAEVSLTVPIKAQGGTGLKINDIRNFEVTENTVYREDGVIISDTRAQGGTGYKIRYKATATNQNVTTGQLEELNLINIYKGPVLSVSPLKIFNNPVLINSDTYFSNGKLVEHLMGGEGVLLSGYIDNQSLAVVTRVELVDDLDQWKISGYVTDLTDNQFVLNNQVIDYLPENLRSCNSALDNYTFVEVLADPVVGFELNDSIDTVIEVNCVDRSVTTDSRHGSVIVEGMIDAVNLGDTFTLAGQHIKTRNSTKYIRGRASDIQERIKVEVQGKYDSVNNSIHADKVRFLEARINIKLPVRPKDFNHSTIDLAGVSFVTTTQTLDPDGVLEHGINDPMQLQLSGYVSDSTELTVTKIVERGSVDYEDVDLSGEISLIQGPMISVFGIYMNTSETEIYDENGMPISEETFYTLISIGTSVSIEGANFDLGSGIVSSGLIKIEDLPEINDKNHKQFNPNQNTVYGVGRITSSIDEVFISKFE